MTLIRKIWTSKVDFETVHTYVGREGEIFYESGVVELRFSDGSTPGGILFAGGGGGGTGPTGPGVPAGGLTDQVLAKASNADYDTKWVNANNVIGNIDGGLPDSNYGGIPLIDAGGIV